MDSDHRWYDVEFVIRGRLRVEGHGKDDAAYNAASVLESIDYNPSGYDNRQLQGQPDCALVDVTFVPQGYRQRDTDRRTSPDGDNR